MRTAKPALFKLMLIASLLVICLYQYATLVVNENIQNWTASTSYGNYTQAIPAGTVSLTSCLVSPNAAASGVGSMGRIQCQASTAIVQFPELSSVGDVQFVFAAGSAGRSVKLQKLVSGIWTDITTFSGIGATGTAFYQRVGIGEPTTLRLAQPSHAIYIHDIFITTYNADPLPEIALPLAATVTYDTASLSAQIESAGSSAITERGFCWSTLPLPDLSGSYLAFGSGISPMSGTITGLIPNTEYYVRAYATNSSGTGFSPQLTITTIGIASPTAQTRDITLYPGSTSVQASWTPGNGSRRIVVINTANSFTLPQDGQEYPANSLYAGTGEQVVYNGATQIVEGEPINDVAVTGLQRNTQYWFRAFELNGTGTDTHYLTITSIDNPNSCTTLNTGLAGYYDNISGYGTSLKAGLHELLRTTHLTQFSYDGVWQQLQYTDEDSLHPNNILETYTGWSVPKSYYGTGADQWNREHTWSVSHGSFGTVRPAGTDLHHLRPCDVTVNSAKGNKDFDTGGNPYVDSTPYPGYSATTGCNTATNSWEPRDVEKGDVARMLFYMAVRYEGTDTTYDLELQDTTPTNGAFYGKLSTLLQWHYADPPDGWERRRNDRIQERQGNRNPFIDHPEYVTRLWVPHATGAVDNGNEGFTAFWTPAINAVSYFVDVSADSLFGSLLSQDFAAGNATEADFSTSGNSVVFFRVRAFFGSGYSPFSNTFRYDTNLPDIVISAFDATITEQGNVMVQWTTEYESNLMGFKVLRAESSELVAADEVSPLISATNTSVQQTYNFTDTGIVHNPQGRYLYYWLQTLALNGTTLYSDPDSVWISPSETEDANLIPVAWKLSAYPNPFCSEITLNLEGKTSLPAKASIYNLKGQKLSQWTLSPADKQTFIWNGADNKGNQAAAGVYVLKVQSGTESQTLKLLKGR